MHEMLCRKSLPPIFLSVSQDWVEIIWWRLSNKGNTLDIYVQTQGEIVNNSVAVY